MKIELLYFEGCPSYEALLPRLQHLLAEAGVDRRSSCVAWRLARRPRGSGSSALRRFASMASTSTRAATRTDFGMKCRLYRSPSGTSPTPSEEWIEAALARSRR